MMIQSLKKILRSRTTAAVGLTSLGLSAIGMSVGPASAQECRWFGTPPACNGQCPSGWNYTGQRKQCSIGPFSSGSMRYCCKKPEVKLGKSQGPLKVDNSFADAERRRLEDKRNADIQKAKFEADRQARLESERQARLNAERQAKLEADRQARLNAERQAKLEPSGGSSKRTGRPAQCRATSQARSRQAGQARSRQAGQARGRAAGQARQREARTRQQRRAGAGRSR